MIVLRGKQLFSDIAARAVDLDRLIEKRNRRYIFAYHRIVPEEVARKECVHDSMWVSPKTFSAQIDWMLRVGEVVAIEKMLDLETENKKPQFSITFDDGWKDNYQYAFPIIKQHGIDATIFLVTSAINTGYLFWPEEIVRKTLAAARLGKENRIKQYIRMLLGKRVIVCDLRRALDLFVEVLKEFSALDRKNMICQYYANIGVLEAPIEGSILSWDEVLEMSRYGISFGSHTHTHAILKYCNPDEILHELVESRKILAEKLMRDVDLFCYPNARYNESDASLLEAVGYKFGFRLHNLCLTKADPRYFIPRVLVNESICGNHNYFRLKLLCMPGA